MGDVRLYSKEKAAEDMQYYEIPDWGWFCRMTGRTGHVFTDDADVKRYWHGIQKAAAREMAEIQLFVYQDGIVYLILSDIDRCGVQKLLRSANAGYGKYKRFQGEWVTFAKWEPLPLRTSLQRWERIGKIFNILHVAREPVSDV